MPHDPKIHGTFGSYMRGGVPLGRGRTVDVALVERTYVTRDQVEEGRMPDGTRYQRTTDQLGNQVTERTDPRGGQHKDVRINLQLRG